MMKYTFTFFSIMIASISGTNAVLSPYVTCCDDYNGKYEIVNGHDGQYGVCKKDGVNTDAQLFYEQNCETPTYTVIALNNCDAKVWVDFALHTDEKGDYEKTVIVKKNKCKVIGETDKETVTYDETGSYASYGFTSCKNVVESGNPECPDHKEQHKNNACVVQLC